MFTYRELIRIYSTNVAKGVSDTDLNPRERRLTSVMLNLASNAGAASVVYPPTDGTRDDTIRHLSDVIWDGGRALVEAASPASADAFSAAIERAGIILRGI